MARSIAAPPKSGAKGARNGAERGGAKRVAAAPIEQTGLTAWTFGDLPEVLDTRVAGGVVRGYPAIVDQGKTVSVRVESTPDAAAAATATACCGSCCWASPPPRRTCRST